MHLRRKDGVDDGALGSFWANHEPPELEDAARALVASGGARGRDVQYWAALERTWSPVDISDLEAIAKYSPEEIRREFGRHFLCVPRISSAALISRVALRAVRP